MFNTELLDVAANAWKDYASFRAKRLRFKKFTYGDQWSDLVTHKGVTMTRARRAEELNRRPVTNNLMRRLVKSVVGRFRYQRQEQPELTEPLRSAFERNNLSTLDCRAFEEFLISGVVVQRVARENTLRGCDVWVENVAADAFFSSRCYDPRGWDINLVGMYHDWSIDEALARLAADDAARHLDLRNTFLSVRHDKACLPRPFSSADTALFLNNPDDRVRVIEVWRLVTGLLLNCHDPLNATIFTRSEDDIDELTEINEQRAAKGEPLIRINMRRRSRWHGTFMTVDGQVLKECEAGAHPFVFTMYPLVDGEIHPLVEDVIEQQVHINELTSLIDHVLATSAKGVLTVPLESLPAGMTVEKLSTLWTAPDAVIPLRSTPGGDRPVQIHNDCSNIGARELLQMQMEMFESISGVTNTLMGRNTPAGMGAREYELQVRNALIAIDDILSSFTDFLQARNKLLLGSLPATPV